MASAARRTDDDDVGAALRCHGEQRAAHVTAARHHGVLTRVLRGRALQVSPAFVITEPEITTMTDGFEAALREVAAR